MSSMGQACCPRPKDLVDPRIARSLRGWPGLGLNFSATRPPRHPRVRHPTSDDPAARAKVNDSHFTNEDK